MFLASAIAQCNLHSMSIMLIYMVHNEGGWARRKEQACMMPLQPACCMHGNANGWSLGLHRWPPGALQQLLQACFR